MLKDFINQILPQILFFIITGIIGFITSLANKWWIAHKSLMEMQKNQILQIMETDKYTQSMKIAKLLIHSVEEQARNFNWDSTIKHAKATEYISKVTDFSSDEIYNIIKATVDEFKTNGLRTAPTENQSTKTVETP